jgi:hypothetical protein
MTFSKKAEKIFNGGLFWNRGFSQIYVLAILLLLILAIPLTVRLTQQSQETRGRAASSACNSGFRSYDDNALRHPDITLNKIRQTVLASDGRTLWHRYGNWNGTDYDTWTAWSIQYGDLNQYGPSGSLSYNSFSELVQADGRIKQVLLQSDGKNLWYRYGNDYDGYTPWTNQYGNLDQYGPSGSLTYLSITEAVVSDGRLKQTLLQSDGKTLWHRYGTWKGGPDYTDWTAWTTQYGDLNQYGPVGGLSYVSFSEDVQSDGRVKQTLLQSDGQTLWYRYGTWNGSDYAGWTAWSNKYNLTEIGCVSSPTPTTVKPTSTPVPTTAPKATLTPKPTTSPVNTPTPVASVYNRVKQTLLKTDGKTLWHRYGTWNGSDYAGWTAWTTQYGDLNQYGPPGGLSYSSFTEHIQTDGKLKQTLLQSNGKTLWHRYGTWNGNDFAGWTAWTAQYGDLNQYGPPGSLAYLSFSEHVQTNGKLKQTLLQSNGKTLWYRYGTWNGSDYAGWTAWTAQYGDLNQYGPPGSLSYSSFVEYVQTDGKLKQTLLQSDGKTLWHRYGTWKGGPEYADWTAWTTQYGNLDQYGPAGGLTYLSYKDSPYPQPTVQTPTAVPTLKPTSTGSPSLKACKCSDPVAVTMKNAGDYNCDQKVDLKDLSLSLIMQWKQISEDLSCSGGAADDIDNWLQKYLAK